MKKFILSIVLIGTILGSPAAKAQSFYSDYIPLTLGLAGSAVCGHISRLISPREVTAENWKWHAGSIGFSVARDLFRALFAKEALDAVLPDWKNVLPNILKSQKPDCLNELEKCRRAAEEFKSAITPINTSSQISAINTLKTDKAVLLIENSLLRIDILLNTWSPDHKRIADSLIILSGKFFEFYPGYSDTNRTFIASPDFKPSPTGESYMYDISVLSNAAAPFELNKRLPKITIEELTRTLDIMAKNGLGAKALYMDRFFSALGIDIPTPESLKNQDL